MGAFDEIVGKAEELAKEHSDQVSEAVDKATDLLDAKTGHTFGSQLDAVDAAVSKAVHDK